MAPDPGRNQSKPVDLRRRMTVRTQPREVSITTGIKTVLNYTWWPCGVHGPIGFGGIHGPKPYKSIGFGGIHGPKPYKFIGLGDPMAPNPTNS